jgi:hypothetical protein
MLRGNDETNGPVCFAIPSLSQSKALLYRGTTMHEYSL